MRAMIADGGAIPAAATTAATRITAWSITPRLLVQLLSGCLQLHCSSPAVCWLPVTCRLSCCVSTQEGRESPV
jgi:hypothetical protein